MLRKLYQNPNPKPKAKERFTIISADNFTWSAKLENISNVIIALKGIHINSPTHSLIDAVFKVSLLIAKTLLVSTPNAIIQKYSGLLKSSALT